MFQERSLLPDEKLIKLSTHLKLDMPIYQLILKDIRWYYFDLQAEQQRFINNFRRNIDAAYTLSRWLTIYHHKHMIIAPSFIARSLVA